MPIIFLIILIALLALWALSFFMNVNTTTRPSRKGEWDLGDFVVSLRVGLPVVAFFWYFVNSIAVVSIGHVGVPVLFNTVKPGYFTESWTPFVNPLLEVADMTYRRRVIEFHAATAAESKDPKRSADADVIVTSSEDVPLNTDVTFAYSLNPKYAGWVYRKMGGDAKYEAEQVRQMARSAMREASSGFTAHEAMTSKRQEFETKIEKEFGERLVVDLIRQGLSEAEANEVYIIYPVQLRKVLPPDKVLNAISERNAAIHDKERQQTLTEIAVIEANRRENEGMGVAKLFGKLPAGFKSEDIALILNAMANKERSDAQMRAVSSGKVSVLIMDGGNVATALPLAAKQ